MDTPPVRAAVADARVARLATVSADGRPHLVPICFALMRDVVYSVVDHKPKRSTALKRVANLEATGHACLLVDAYSCLLYTSPSPRDGLLSRMPSSA